MKRYTLLVLLFMLFWLVPILYAQDVTPEPTAEPVPVDTTTTTTTTTTTETGQNIGAILTWALAFIAVWQAAGIAYAVTVEKTIKPVLTGIVSQFTENIAVRNGLLILSVFVGAFYAVYTGGINLFADAPFEFLKTAPASFLLILNSLFVATGAFMGHEIWDWIESWLKKAKAVNEVITS